MILKIEHLSHRYSSEWAIRDVNIEIAEHGIIGLLGSNGAGKSTTMNIICGVINQSEGSVSINGADIRKNPLLAKQHIGFLPQNPPVFMDLSVDEYLTFAAEIRLIPDRKVKEAVEEAKEKTGITALGKRLIKNLSGGFRQRVAISQAIIHKPKLVVMDEPTNGLDPNQLIDARKLIREIAQERTVLLSSHILSEIQMLCQKIIMLEAGKVIFSDTMESFNNYLQPDSVLVRFINPPGIQELQSISGVSNVEYLTKYQARISIDGEEDITERIIALGGERNWRIREVTLEKGKLDDIFKHLSNKSTQ